MVTVPDKDAVTAGPVREIIRKPLDMKKNPSIALLLQALLLLGACEKAEHPLQDNPGEIEALSVITISDTQKVGSEPGLSEADQARDGSKGYANVGIRVVRVDR